MLSLTRYMPRALAILFAVYLIPSLASASTNQFTIEPIPDASVVEFTRYESPVPVTSNAQGAITWQVLPFDAPNFLDWLGELLCSITDIEASINVFEVDPATGIVSLEAQKHRSGNNCSNKYWVYLVATDSQGNKAEVKWRITITEDTSPVFILRGISDQQIEEYDGYTSPRPYATGKVLGNLSYTLHDPSGKFSVDSSTGVVTLPPANSAYDTTPGASNSYSLTLTAKDDGDRSNTLNWTVTVTPIPPGSELTLSGPIDSTISENVDYRSTTIRATGKHTPPFTFSKDGVDAHLYEVNSAGIVTLPRKDFENPEDSNGDNIYEITVIATDANGYSASLSWNITVTDAPPRTFTISYASDTIVEGNSYLSNPPTMLGDAPWQPAVFSLKNDGLCGDDAIDDACLISIDPSTGRISLPAKAHAEPEDLDGDNLYTATIVLTDEEGSTTEAVWNLRVTFNMMKDTDGDGVLDTFELAEGTDPTSATSYLSVSGNTPDAVSIDADADGISNSQESAGINPYGDNNSDGVPNYLDPVDRGDNKAALCTIKMVSGFPDNTGTLMSKAICDMQFGLDPIFDNDQDGIANFRDNDSDNDGI